jgi:hypothetical protein
VEADLWGESRAFFVLVYSVCLWPTLGILIQNEVSVILPGLAYNSIVLQEKLGTFSTG